MSELKVIKPWLISSFQKSELICDAGFLQEVVRDMIKVFVPKVTELIEKLVVLWVNFSVFLAELSNFLLSSLLVVVEEEIFPWFLGWSQ